MVKVNKVAHVVLNVKDPQASAEWYRDALGMEQVTFNPGAQMAFLSFGDQHHDIALMKAPVDAQHGQLGLNHVALQIEGGEEELRTLYGRLLSMDTRISRTTDHGLTRSVYFFDPDGNQLEIFCEQMTQAEGKAFLQESTGWAKPMELEPINTP